MREGDKQRVWGRRQSVVRQIMWSLSLETREAHRRSTSDLSYFHPADTLTAQLRRSASMTSHHEGAWKSNPQGVVTGQMSVDFCFYTQDHTIFLWNGCVFDHHFWAIQISIVYSHCLFFSEQKCIASYVPLLLFA